MVGHLVDISKRGGHVHGIYSSGMVYVHSLWVEETPHRAMRV